MTQGGHLRPRPRVTAPRDLPLFLYVFCFPCMALGFEEGFIVFQGLDRTEGTREFLLLSFLLLSHDTRT